MTARLREQYRLRASLPVYRNRVARSRVLLRHAAERGTPAVLFSGGKDSLALLHLTCDTLGPTPAFFIDSGAETPWTYQAIAETMALGYDVRVVQPRLTHPRMLQLVGARGYDGPERLPGAWHWRARDGNEVLLYEPARRIAAEGFGVHLLGLRAEESRGRAMNRASRGVLYQRRGDPYWIATPLANWEGADILAYCLIHELPLSQEYRRPGDDAATREHRRTSLATGRTAVTYGRWRELREDHPALWQELAALFPAMRDDA